MSVFIILIIMIFICFFILYSSGIRGKGKIYCILIGVFLCFIAFFRHETVGLNDTKMVYLPQFQSIQKCTFSYIFVNYKDPVFYIISKIFSLVSTNERIWLMLINIPLILSATRLIYKESKNYLLSFIMFISLGFYTLCSFTVLRHSIALAFIILAYYQIKEKNFKKFILYTILASLFHQTAIIFIFAYWIGNLKMFDKKYYIIFIAFILSIISKNALLKLIWNVSEEGRYTYFHNNNTELSYTSFFINLLIIIVADLFSSKEYKKTKQYLINSRLITVGCCLSAFMVVLGEFNRLSMFYLIYEIVWFPNCILSNSNRKNNSFLILGTSVCFSLYLLMFGLANSGLLNYSFFWS